MSPCPRVRAEQRAPVFPRAPAQEAGWLAGDSPPFALAAAVQRAVAPPAGVVAAGEAAVAHSPGKEPIQPRSGDHRPVVGVLRPVLPPASVEADRPAEGRGSLFRASLHRWKALVTSREAQVFRAPARHFSLPRPRKLLPCPPLWSHSRIPQVPAADRHRPVPVHASSIFPPPNFFITRLRKDSFTLEMSQFIVDRTNSRPPMWHTEPASWCFLAADSDRSCGLPIDPVMQFLRTRPRLGKTSRNRSRCHAARAPHGFMAVNVILSVGIAPRDPGPVRSMAFPSIARNIPPGGSFRASGRLAPPRDGLSQWSLPTSTARRRARPSAPPCGTVSRHRSTANLSSLLRIRYWSSCWM